MLTDEAQHSCPQWPPSAALCPGCCPLQKLDAQVKHSPGLEAVMCVWTVKGFLC